MNYHYGYRLGPRSRPFISIDSQVPSRKSFELISQNYRYRYRLEMFLKWDYLFPRWAGKGYIWMQSTLLMVMLAMIWLD